MKLIISWIRLGLIPSASLNIERLKSSEFLYESPLEINPNSGEYRRDRKTTLSFFSKREQCLLISPLTHSIRDWGSVNVRISFVHFLSTKLPDVLINSWWTCWPVPLIVIYCIDFKGDEVILYRLSLIRRATN